MKKKNEEVENFTTLFNRNVHKMGITPYEERFLRVLLYKDFRPDFALNISDKPNEKEKFTPAKLTISEIRESSSLSKSTIFRVRETLSKKGFLKWKNDSGSSATVWDTSGIDRALVQYLSKPEKVELSIKKEEVQVKIIEKEESVSTSPNIPVKDIKSHEECSSAEEFLKQFED